MNSSILNSILRDELRPWLIKFEDTRKLKEILQAVSKIGNGTPIEVNHRLQVLLQPFPELLSSVNNATGETINTLTYSCQLPKPVSLINHFYKELIETETIRYFNQTISNPLIENLKLDVPYQVGQKTLKGIASLANSVNNDLLENNLIDEHDPIKDQTQYALVFLRNKLIALYFSIQEWYKEYLPTIYKDIDEFYLYCMDNDVNKINVDRQLNSKGKISISKSNNQAFSFGFKGNRDNLTNLVQVLCTHKNFLDEEVTTPETIVNVLTSKDITAAKTKIKFGCNSNLLTCIVDRLQLSIPGFTYANIEMSGIFFSKTDKPIKQSLFSNSKSNNPLPKDKKEEIDKIFRENNM